VDVSRLAALYLQVAAMSDADAGRQLKALGRTGVAQRE